MWKISISIFLVITHGYGAEDYFITERIANRANVPISFSCHI